MQHFAPARRHASNLAVVEAQAKTALTVAMQQCDAGQEAEAKILETEQGVIDEVDRLVSKLNTCKEAAKKLAANANGGTSTTTAAATTATGDDSQQGQQGGQPQQQLLLARRTVCQRTFSAR